MIDSKDDKDKKQTKTAAAAAWSALRLMRSALHQSGCTPPDADEAGGGLPPQSRWRTSALLSQKMAERDR